MRTGKEMCECKDYPHRVYPDRNRIRLRVNGGLVYHFLLLDDSLQYRRTFQNYTYQGGGAGSKV